MHKEDQLRSDLRELQKIVENYLEQHHMTREEFAEKAGPALSRGKVGYLVTGHATSLDVLVLAAYARGLEIPFCELARAIGIV